jgi:hypothetical protein
VTSQRVLTLVEMVRRFNEARETMGHVGLPGSGDRIPLMPDTWTESYRELERVLLRLREERPKRYWHLSTRYLKASERQCELAFRAGRYVGLYPNEAVLKGFAGSFDPIWDTGPRDKAAKGTPTGQVIVQTWSPLVRRQVVRDAVLTVDEWFPGSPYLPKEMLEAA